MTPARFFTEKGQQHPDQQKNIHVILDADGQNLPRNRGADVGPHNHAYGLGQLHEARVHKTDGHHRGGAAALDEHGDQSPYQHAQKRRAGQHAHEMPQPVPGHQLEGVADELYGIQKDADATQKLNDKLDCHEGSSAFQGHGRGRLAGRAIFADSQPPIRKAADRQSFFAPGSGPPHAWTGSAQAPIIQLPSHRYFSFFYFFFVFSEDA